MRRPSVSQLGLFLLDATMVAAAHALAFLFRFDMAVPAKELPSLIRSAPVVLVIYLSLFHWFGCYRVLWRYGSITDFACVVRATLVGFAVTQVVAVFVFHQLWAYPRSVPLLEMVIILMLAIGTRIGPRAARELGRGRRASRRAKRVLIIGAGRSADTVLREMRSNYRLDYRPVGLLDDDPAKLGRSLQGVRVLGPIERLAHFAKQVRADEVLIAIPSATPREFRRITEIARAAALQPKTLPAIADIMTGRTSVSRLRNVEIEDLLGRATHQVDRESIARYVRGTTVLVTGAGGSIGAEICRQLLELGPARLVLFGHGENSIYQVHKELSPRRGETELEQVVGDVANYAKLARLFALHRPNVVFHSAAQKHVPLCEMNVDQAVATNIVGTANLLQVAVEHGAERVICISTDKAVEPRSIMGCSKRAMEQLVIGQTGHKTVVAAVRFGNVLGSRGSVVPLFREQIARGGPVTVTHPEMTRFFMTVQEAARLVLRAGSLARGGEIFMLDMGEPVRIADVAKEMIRLSGLEPERDIPIEYIGIRPGEKLHEALVNEGERLVETAQPGIWLVDRLRPVASITAEDLQLLHQLIAVGDEQGIREQLHRLVPAYASSVRSESAEAPAGVSGAAETSGDLSTGGDQPG